MAEVQQVAQAVGQIDIDANAAPAEEAMSQNGQGKRKMLQFRNAPEGPRDFLKIKTVLKPRDPMAG